MKFLAIKVLNFCGIWCGIKPTSITIKGPRGAAYRVLEASINEHGDIVAEVTPCHEFLHPEGMSLEEVATEKLNTDGYALGVLRFL